MNILFFIRLFGILFFTLGVITQLCFAGEKPQESAEYQISSIKAYLYFEQKGNFSENIIDNPKFGKGALWNTIIGGGSAASPSHATMIVVEVTGKPRQYETKRRLNFVASEDKKVILQKIVRLGGLNEAGNYYAAFWLYETGCKPITLRVKMIGQSLDSKIEKIIDFECGE